MKKSKIIVPALAIIAFSAAASIAGSVAWFTATRQASVNAGTYAVVKTNANLACKAVAGVGTTANNSDTTKVIGVDSNHTVLTDGSFNHKTKNIYTPNEEGTGFAASPRDEIALINEPTSSDLEVAEDSTTTYIEKLIRGTTSDSTPNTIYTAVTFNLEFTVSFGSVSGNLGLYLDAASASKFEVANGNTPVTATGFRMAFIGFAAKKKTGTNTYVDAEGSTTRSIVFADLQTSANCAYVQNATGSFPTAVSTAGSSQYTASDYDLIDSAYTTALPADGAASESRPDYLGKFAYIAGTEVTLKYTVVCWYEGTDPNIVNQDLLANYQSVKATLSFKTVKFAA